MDRTEKREFVSALGQVFAETSMVVVTLNKGMTVAEVSDLRRRMRASGSTFKVAKNRLAALALDGTRFDGIKALAELPSLDALRARRVGLLQAPATKVAGVLQAPAGQLARVFGAYAKKDEATDGVAEAA